MPSSLLATDGYKFAMAEAGHPLRRETFYYSHRRGGPHYLPFDVATVLAEMLPDSVSAEEDAFLAGSGYTLGGGARAALADTQLTIRSLPRGSWFFDREPVFTVTGRSALVSWLEPLVLQLHYRVQVATMARLAPERLAEAVGVVTCARQRDIVLETLDAVGVHPAFAIETRSERYVDEVRERVRDLVAVVGDPDRLFELGLRSATCMEQHELTLTACRDAGLRATSSVLGASRLGLKTVGTMGHEHVQRFRSDETAFRAMRDRHPGPSAYLLDTFSTVFSGLPTALRLIAEEPDRRDFVRFDSGDKETQFLIACSMARSLGLAPRFLLEDGFTAEQAHSIEQLRALQRVPPEDVLYGFGGYIVRPDDDPLSRDRVAAVWKLSRTGPHATMKFGDELGHGKESLPGEPVVHRRYDEGHWSGVVAQLGEDPGEDALLTGSDVVPPRLRFTPSEAVEFSARPLHLSPHTLALRSSLYAERERLLRAP